MLEKALKVHPQEVINGIWLPYVMNMSGITKHKEATSAQLTIPQEAPGCCP